MAPWARTANARRSTSGTHTHQKADDALVKALYQVSTGEHLTSTTKTVGDLCVYWRDVVLDVREGTATRYGSALDQHIIPALGKLQVQALTADHVLRAFRTWEKEGLAAGSRRHLHAMLHRIFAIAIEQHLLLRNPMDAVKCPAVAPTEIQVWTEEQLDTFLQATEQVPFWGALWHLGAMTGMRRGELLGLKWRNVDWARGHLHVRQQIRTLRPQARVRRAQDADQPAHCGRGHRDYRAAEEPPQAANGAAPGVRPGLGRQRPGLCPPMGAVPGTLMRRVHPGSRTVSPPPGTTRSRTSTCQ